MHDSVSSEVDRDERAGSAANGGAGSAFGLSVSGGMIALWTLLIHRFGSGDVYTVMGPYACAVIGVCCALRPHALRAWLRFDRRAIAIGLGIGVGMTLATYPVFRLAVLVVPSLQKDVQVLYVGAHSTSMPLALAGVTAILIAEELLFRGVWPSFLATRMSKPAAYAVSLCAYTIAQFGTGSIIVALMALVCGGIWTVQRYKTGSLLSPLLSHLIWTPTVLLLCPVT